MRICSRVVLAALLALIFSVAAIFVPSSAVAITAGDVLVADPGSGTIHRYSASGGDLGVFVGDLSPSWITADQFGNIYVSEHDGQRISKFPPAGANLTIATPYNPGGIQVGRDGMIYVADYFGGKVYRYSADGTALGLFASLPFPAQAEFMAFDAGGNLYVTDSFLEAVHRISPTGEDLGDFVVDVPGAAGIAFDADGNLYLASFNSGIIEKYASSGTDLGIFVSVGADSSMHGIALDGAGNLYVANSAERSIHRFSPAGGDMGVFASTGLVAPRDLVIIPLAPAPTVKEECKQGGWLSFDSFKNQGDCIQFINTGK